jgi:hypothetical protein
LRKVVNHLEPDTNLHAAFLSGAADECERIERYPNMATKPRNTRQQPRRSTAAFGKKPWLFGLKGRTIA